jgi:signal peptidase I
MPHSSSPPSPSQSEMMSRSALVKRKPSGLLENVKTIIYAGLIAIGIRTIAFEPFNIPSGSMIPTLLVGDYLFVSKYSYGYSRYSLPFSLDLFSGRIFGALPVRGDVAVFKFTKDIDDRENTHTDYIKRIIGLPGDRIKVESGQLYINGTMVPRVPAGQCNSGDTGSNMLDARFLETLPNGRTHYICKTSDAGPQNNTPEYTVPPGYFFAMGDNRDNSADSRFQDRLGYVPMENLVGRAEFIFFSIDASAPWWEVWEWPLEIRWSRLFSGIY